ncbi:MULTISPECIES: hypothetical protein [Niastella]|uniref:Uncharacterized protein n=1 Tax=Niastella soli TaxID=2821487 RepID=A0ABS3YPF5_9BACT|nr:hypothetical protein [Niastella soli]MBO9199734.1 hypothetical protein [Niastella soli]
MTNTSKQRPRGPIIEKQETPSSILSKLKVPNIEFTRFKSYQHRTKEWSDGGYSGRVADSGRVRLHKRGNVTIKGFPAWRFGFRNMHQSTVDIQMHFSVYDKYGLVESFSETYTNLRPSEPAEIFVVQGKKKTRLKLETVEVYGNSQLLSSTEVGAVLPPRGFIKTFLLPLIMCFFAMGIVGSPAFPDEKGPAVIITLLTFLIAFIELFNITPVFFMFFLMLMVPFSLQDPTEISVLLILGALYLWMVWRKRYSLKDFLIGAFIA